MPPLTALWPPFLLRRIVIVVVVTIVVVVIVVVTVVFVISVAVARSWRPCRHDGGLFLELQKQQLEIIKINTAMTMYIIIKY